MPLIAVPVFSLVVFAVCDLIRRPKVHVAYFETPIEMAALFVIFSAYACMLGLHFSLKNKKTVKAVIVSVGLLLVVNLGAFLFWNAIVKNAEVAAAGLSPATPFTAISYIVNPDQSFDSQATLAGNITAVRISGAVGSVIFLAIHAMIVFAWYKSMVRNFDMIIRKQSGQ